MTGHLLLDSPIHMYVDELEEAAKFTTKEFSLAELIFTR
jgi:hypothetical protein